MTALSDLLTYEGIVGAIDGATVLVSEDCGSYQGDIVFLVEKDGLYACTTIGYGSCSACDALQAVTPWSAHWEDEANLDTAEVQDFLAFVKQTQDDFEFKPAAEVLSDISSQLDDPNGNHWYFYDSEIRAALLTKVVPLLEQVVAAAA